MLAIIVDSTASAAHPVPEGNPEHAGRYEAVRDRMRGMDGLHWVESEPATRPQLARFHTDQHIERVLNTCASAEEGELIALDWDTHVTHSSAAAALQAAGGVVLAVDRVMEGPETLAFSLARPPGHHAEPDRAMGFCLFNSIAVGALHALDARSQDRVAIIDFDVHHGNGSQVLAERDERVFFASLHQAPLYPGSGSASETGLNGNVLNIPLPEATPAAQWRATFERDVLPAIDRFEPGMIFVSAGFDAHLDDPLGGLTLRSDDYRWLGHTLAAKAREHSEGRLVAALEGGYDCPALARSAAAFVGGLQGA